ncbi:hypothetical protein [Mesorhizobium sp.]|uniref:hypothetical protein n=1 Tax=Mesorhizobium sp. TaxID=1871066 RepID=UPI000FE66006|nr:hypothetical protein [Mesorhizobium sp.]RWK41090.1 MAG: hypothetical protein EOR46_18645 [Mesorhizobium sp.]RWK67141.1 MAG: hypothetical protein EOR54_20810 [Mesorhizobium sp.]RWK73609.1 MAG: hypothetical protein EOR50_22840 [Mesorhizobium sp.]RWK77458.1 MAG: hypothetical protein EOR51_26375 [Mesorhizobium sp.]RWL00704.1 MAG: hypothetical protein EOR55_28090 [Mesorhizobium sp.]
MNTLYTETLQIVTCHRVAAGKSWPGLSGAPFDAKSVCVGKDLPAEQGFAEFHALWHHFCKAASLAAAQRTDIARRVCSRLEKMPTCSCSGLRASNNCLIENL